MPQTGRGVSADIRQAGESFLLLVFAWKLVRMAQHDLPLTALPAVSLRAAQGPGLRTTAGVPRHVFQIDGIRQVVTDHCHYVLHMAICGSDAFRGPVEPGADLLPPALVTAERPHDHNIVSVRPQCLERFRAPFNQLAQGLLAHHHELVPGLVHAFDDARAGAEPEALGSW
jgi:hypothetical protein